LVYSGNPAGVCLLDSPRSDEWMQGVAGEMNLSETAFLQKEEGGFNLRWFTPKVEVDLCGHATLASAHLLWVEKVVETNRIVFNTKSGELTAEKNDEWIDMNFPLEPPDVCEIPNELSLGLGIDVEVTQKNRMAYLVEVSSEEVLRNLNPNFEELKKIDSYGVIVTCRSEHDEYDFLSRCFFPALGVNEDPVTGSAHCCLGPYWSSKLNKNELTAFQASKRTGLLKLKI